MHSITSFKHLLIIFSFTYLCYSFLEFSTCLWMWERFLRRIINLFIPPFYKNFGSQFFLFIRSSSESAAEQFISYFTCIPLSSLDIKYFISKYQILYQGGRTILWQNSKTEFLSRPSQDPLKILSTSPLNFFNNVNDFIVFLCNGASSWSQRHI